MEIDTFVQDNIIILKLSGKFNIDHVEKFNKLLNDYFRQSVSAIAIELHRIEYLDSSALGSLIKAMNIAKTNKIDFCLYNLEENILSVFRLSYLDKFFVILTKEEMSSRYPGISF